MPFKNYLDRAYEVDEDGFLLDPMCWDENWMRYHGGYLGMIPEEHIKVFDHIRMFHNRNGYAPILRILADRTSFSSGKIINMFTYVKKEDAVGKYAFICKIAGMPQKALTGVGLIK